MRHFVPGSTTAVLIGGPADGRRVTMQDPSNPLPYLQVEVEVEVEVEVACPPVRPMDFGMRYEVVVYRAERVREGDYEYTVYVHGEGLFLGKLLAGYRRP